MESLWHPKKQQHGLKHHYLRYLVIWSLHNTRTHAHTVSWPCAAAGLHWRKQMYQRVCPCCPYWAAPVSIQELEAQFSIRGPPLGPCSGRPPFRKARVELRQLTSFINGFCVWLPRCWFHSIYIHIQSNCFWMFWWEQHHTSSKHCPTNCSRFNYSGLS